MPIQRTARGGKSAYRWGRKGKAYTYKSGNKATRNAARRKAARQGAAIHARKA